MSQTSHDAGFLLRLRDQVKRELNTYVYKVPDDAIGQPMSAAIISQGLAEMRESLVEPFWSDVEIRDTFEQVGMQDAPKRRCAVVADDRKGMVLVYDPSENNFVLA